MIDRLRSGPDRTASPRLIARRPVTTFATALHPRRARSAPTSRVFGLIDRAILTPARHVVRPDRLFTLAFGVPGDVGRGAGMTTTSYVAFNTIREHVPAFAPVAAWRRTSTTVIVAGEQTHVEAMLVSGSYFAVLGRVPPAGPRDSRPRTITSRAATAVISHAFWRSAFGGDPARARPPPDGQPDRVSSCPASCPRASAAIPRRGSTCGCRSRRRCDDAPGWNLDALPQRREHHWRGSQPGEDVAAAAQATAALERRVSLVGLGGGDVAPTIVVSPMRCRSSRSSSSSSGSRMRPRFSSCAARARDASPQFARLWARHAAGSFATDRARSGDSGDDGDGWCAGARRPGWAKAVRQLLLTGVIENDGLTSRTFLAALAAGLGSACDRRGRRPAAVAASRAGGGSLGASHGARRSRAYTDAPAGADDALGGVDCGRGPLRTQSVQPDGAGLRHAPGHVVLVGFERGPGPVARSGRDLPRGAGALAVDARRRAGN